ncbi:MAG: DNA polymerase III subunit beta [Bacteroidota bacterium]|jgi:DNA polymerase-3 subunit beta
MNFVISTTALLKQLKAISGVLNSSNTLPILDNFLFEVKKGELIIHASDMETTIITKVPVESNDTGTIAIPARPLIETLSNFPEQPVSFSIDTAKQGIKLATDNGEFKLTGFNGDEFPRVPKIEGASSMTIKTDVLASAITKTIFATGTDDLRPVMTGVFCQFSDQESLFIATDAHKLVRYRRTDAKGESAAAFILPKKPLNLIKNLLSGVDDVVKVDYNKTNASFSFQNNFIICRLIDGKYPNVDAVIPKQNPNKLTIDRSALLGALKRVSIFSNKSTYQVRFKIVGSALDIYAEDLDFSNEAHERLNCTYAGEDMEIGFNSRFMVEMLSNLDSDEIAIEMSAPNRAGIITPVQKNNPQEDVLMLVMPVMLNN